MGVIMYNELLNKNVLLDKITNKEWIDILSFQFDVSRTNAKTMLHLMMEVKKTDNIIKGIKYHE